MSGQFGRIQLDNLISHDAPENFPHRILQPYRVQSLEYNKIKATIFNETLSVPLIHKRPTPPTTRSHRFWKSILNKEKLFCSAFLSDVFRSDIQPFVSVQLFRQDVVGPVDTGTLVSVLIMQKGFFEKIIHLEKVYRIFEDSRRQ